MLAISVHITVYSAYVGAGNTLVAFKANSTSQLFFQMKSQVFSVPGQTEGRRKAFLKWKSIDLSNELSLTCGGNVNYYKSVHHPIPTRENRGHPISKQISKLCF